MSEQINDENCAQMPFKSVVVSGAGLMGIGIVECCIQSGYKTSLVARNEEKVKLARQEIQTFFHRRSSKLFPDDAWKAQQWLNEKMSKLNVDTSLKQALVGSDLFIEAVVENREIKQDLLAEVEELASPGIILVTNTSSMRLNDLGEKLQRPELLGGLHFFSPVPAMKLVEVVKSDKTSDEVAIRLDAFGKSLDKVTILCKDTPGFVVNRMILPLLNISHKLLDEGVASPESIDVGSKLAMNLPMGLLTLSDLIGLDTIRNVNNEMMKYEGIMDLRPSETLDRLVEQGKLGRKTGCGFFDYTNKSK